MEQHNRSYLKLIPVLAFFLSVGSLYYFGSRSFISSQTVKGTITIPAPYSEVLPSYMEEPVAKSTQGVPPPPPREIVLPTPAPTPAPTVINVEKTNDDRIFWTRAGVSAIVLFSSLFMVFSGKRFSAGDLKWAYAMIGTVVGFWLR